MLDVECWMFLLFTFITLPLYAQTSSKNMLPPLAPAYGQMQPTFWERYGIATVIYGLAFIVWLGFIYWLFFRRQPPLVAPPEILACRNPERDCGPPAGRRQSC